MTVDRYMSVKIKAWRIIYFKQNQAILTSCLIGIILILFNSHLLVINGKVENGITNCYAKGENIDWIFIWKLVYLFKHNLIYIH